MRILLACVTAVVATLWLGYRDVDAADLQYRLHRTIGVRGSWGSVEKCGRDGCTLQHVCRSRCHGYVWRSLYGAYGPYGGAPYWGAYTQAIR